MRLVCAAHGELAFRTLIKNTTWACAGCAGDALIDTACCTRGWICFSMEGTAEHLCGSSGCYMETKQLTPVDRQGCDAVAEAALPGFPSCTACKSCFCDEAKRNNRGTAAPRAHGMTVGLQEAQPSESPQAASHTSQSPSFGWFSSSPSPLTDAPIHRGSARLQAAASGREVPCQPCSLPGHQPKGQPPRYPGQGRQPSSPCQHSAVQMCTDVRNARGLTVQWRVLGRNGDVGAAPDTPLSHAAHEPQPSLLPLRLGTALMQRSQAGFWSGKGSVIHYLCPGTDRIVINTFFESCR